jgi:hypothetical protein
MVDYVRYFRFVERLIWWISAIQKATLLNTKHTWKQLAGLTLLAKPAMVMLLPLHYHLYPTKLIYFHRLHCRICQTSGARGDSEPEPSPAQVNTGMLPPWMLRPVSNRWAKAILPFKPTGPHRHRQTIDDPGNHCCAIHINPYWHNR